MPYIFLTIAASLVSALSRLVNPFIMKYFNMGWQIAINGVTTAIYMIICLVLLYFFGLFGFCLGTLLTYILKFIFILIIYFKCNIKE